MVSRRAGVGVDSLLGQGRSTGCPNCKQDAQCKSRNPLEKPSFRAAARYRRCLIYVDGFFEHQHRKGKRFPFFIRQKDSEVMCLAGVYEDWTDPLTGEIKRTCSIVTTKGHGEMISIHNNPKLP